MDVLKAKIDLVLSGFPHGMKDCQAAVPATVKDLIAFAKEHHIEFRPEHVKMITDFLVLRAEAIATFESKERNYHANSAAAAALKHSLKKWAETISARFQEDVEIHNELLRRSATGGVEQIMLEDIDSLNEAIAMPPSDYLPSTVSEDDFIECFKKAVGEKGRFPHWPGEKYDLYTTQLVVKGKRRATAIAFKGPGTGGKKLTPKQMGKNADQIQRLFDSAAEVFLVQYCRQIDESVIRQMRDAAIAKSQRAGAKLFYGILDGTDSERIYRAYAAVKQNS